MQALLAIKQSRLSRSYDYLIVGEIVSFSKHLIYILCLLAWFPNIWYLSIIYRAEILSLEKPVETAVLLGLTGVKTVCLNQWHCTVAENAEKLETTMKGEVKLINSTAMLYTVGASIRTRQ